MLMEKELDDLCKILATIPGLRKIDVSFGPLAVASSELGPPRGLIPIRIRWINPVIVIKMAVGSLISSAELAELQKICGCRARCSSLKTRNSASRECPLLACR